MPTNIQAEVARRRYKEERKMVERLTIALGHCAATLVDMPRDTVRLIDQTYDEACEHLGIQSFTELEEPK